MSESQSKDDSNAACAAASKPCDSDKGSQNAGTRDKYQRNFRGDRRSNTNYSRGRSHEYRNNRGSSRGGYRNDRFGTKPFKRNWSDSQHDGKRKKLEIGDRLKETDVGITEFVGEEKFSGIIKERYSDFNVNEIDLDGQIAKLTNQDIPRNVEENVDIDNLKQTIPEAIWDQLQALKETQLVSIEVDVTDLDKEQRRAIHGIAKNITNVISQTIDKENKKILVITRNEKGKPSGHNFRRDNRVDWKKRGGEYCHFLLHKTNMDTMSAVNQLAMNLRLRPNNFSYAGTKDRRARTTQWVSLRKVEPSDILRASKCIRGAFVGNFKFAKEPLKLGMLTGNHFRIALRNVVGTDEQIEKAMVSLRDNGMINYCGLQRFGTIAAIPTYEIGKVLLQGKWNEAIELILKPRDGEQDKDLVEARRIYATTKDANAAYSKIRESDKIEAMLLKGLCSSGSNNPQGALDSIPRNTRLLYVHAYQSLIWNHMVSRRIREFGKKPIVGDLVYDRSVTEQDKDKEDFIDDHENEPVGEGDDNVSGQDTERTGKIIKLESSTEVDRDTSETEGLIEASEQATTTSINEVTDATKCCLKIDENIEDKNTTTEKVNNVDLHNIPAVKILTEDDLPNYTLADVLMPLVGWKVTYPPYAKPWIDEFLVKDGLTTDLRQKNKKYNLGGTYRRILRLPLSVSWKIVHYKEKHSDLILSDIDEMRKVPALQDEPDGQYKAVIIEMSLKSSTYATVALREILKCDTSPGAQVALCVARDSELDSKQDSTLPKNDEQRESSTVMDVDDNNSQEEKPPEMEGKESGTAPAIEVDVKEQSDIKAEVADAL